MAAGSIAIRPLLLGPPRPARVVVAVPSAAYLRLDDPDDGPDGAAVVAVLAPQAVRVPLGVVVPDLPAVRVGDAGWVGGAGVGIGAVGIGGRAWRVLRWFDPTVRRAHPVRVPLPSGVGRVGRVGAAERALHRWLRQGGSPAPAVAGLVGLGEGLTPEGDDVLAGLLVALAARGDARREPLAAAVTAAVTATPARTTTVSAALLREAVAGRAIPQLARFVTTGTGLADLLAVGHTSGAALARGAMAA